MGWLKCVVGRMRHVSPGVAHARPTAGRTEKGRGRAGAGCSEESGGGRGGGLRPSASAKKLRGENKKCNGAQFGEKKWKRL